jgi:hypothetical protein
MEGRRRFQRGWAGFLDSRGESRFCTSGRGPALNAKALHGNPQFRLCAYGERESITITIPIPTPTSAKCEFRAHTSRGKWTADSLAPSCGSPETDTRPIDSRVNPTRPPARLRYPDRKGGARGAGRRNVRSALHHSVYSPYFDSNSARLSRSGPVSSRT